METLCTLILLFGLFQQQITSYQTEKNRLSLTLEERTEQEKAEQTKTRKLCCLTVKYKVSFLMSRCVSCSPVNFNKILNKFCVLNSSKCFEFSEFLAAGTMLL